MEKFKPTNIKGATDTLPPQQILRNRVIEVLRRNFELHGFAPIETASLNYREVLAYKYDDDAEIVREIYKIQDLGERELGLRFDLTVPFCKFIATNRNLKMPFRRYEIGKVWRNGPVRAGRLREFYQCDIDVVGQQGAEVEAEIIALAIRCFLDLGIKPIIKYGNRNVLKSVIEGAGVKSEHVDKVVTLIDKMEKITRKELEAELGKFMDKGASIALLTTFEKMPKNDEVRNLEKLLNDMGIAKYCVYTPSLARGLNVYTGTIWEVVDGDGRLDGSLGGGGRYDKIITDWVDNGLQYPAVGMAFGLEPIMFLLENSMNQDAHTVDLLLVSMKDFAQAHNVANRLRERGIRTLVLSTKVSKAFEYADKTGIPQVAVLGEREIMDGKLRIKNMSSGEESEENI